MKQKVKKKKILVDLSILKHLHCGLGQVALNYGKYYRDQYSQGDFEIHLLLPKHMKGEFGSNVKYLAVNWWRKHILSLIPRYDAWHAIHQLSHFRPVNKSTKYLLTIHDLNFMYEKSGLKQEKMLFKLQRKVDRADKIVCISEFAKSETLKYLDVKGKTVDVIYNGVEESKPSQGQRPEFIKEGKPFFFTIGQIKKKKNFQVLVPLMKYYPEKELYIAGQNTTAHAEHIRTLIKKEGVTNVHLVGNVKDEERTWLYRNCEAFLFPSLFEGFGLPVIEAMSYGKPVISSRETSLQEIGGERACFFDNFDPLHMKEIIDDHLFQFHQSHDDAHRNREYAQTFSYDKHMQQYINLYQELLNT